MKICLAGKGAMGEIHMKALQKIEDVQVISLNSPPMTVASLRGKVKIPFQSTNLEECIDRPWRRRCDSGRRRAACTLTRQFWPSTRASTCRSNSHEPESARCQAHAGVAKKTGKICMVTHTRRFSSPHREIRRRILEGKFHLQHMVCRNVFFRRTNLNSMAPRDPGSIIYCASRLPFVDLAYWVQNDPNLEVWGQKGPDHRELGIPMDMTIGMRSKKGPVISMALSFNNRGPFGGFYRYIGEEETYKVYRDSMTDSEGKEVPLDGVAAFDRQDVEFVSAVREGREPESSAASCVPTMALLDGMRSR